MVHTHQKWGPLEQHKRVKSIKNLWETWDKISCQKKAVGHVQQWNYMFQVRTLKPRKTKTWIGTEHRQFWASYIMFMLMDYYKARPIFWVRNSLGESPGMKWKSPWCSGSILERCIPQKPAPSQQRPWCIWHLASSSLAHCPPHAACPWHCRARLTARYSARDDGFHLARLDYHESSSWCDRCEHWARSLELQETKAWRAGSSKWHKSGTTNERCITDGTMTRREGA